MINEESEGIDQNIQIRSQGIIALSYHDWEVRPRKSPQGGSDPNLLPYEPTA